MLVFPLIADILNQFSKWNIKNSETYASEIQFEIDNFFRKWMKKKIETNFKNWL